MRPAAEDERTGCLATLGLALGTFVASFVLVLVATLLINSIPASRVGSMLGVVFLVHMVGIGLTRGRLRRGAQLLRTAAIVVAVEVGAVVLVLLFAALVSS